MIIQIINILSGLVLSTPILKALAGTKGAEHIAGVETTLNSFRVVIGIAALVLGVVALIERLGIVYVGSIGASFPQALAALACGVLLAPNLFQKFPAIQASIQKLAPYAAWVGIAGVAIGLGSLLFGCVSPVCYSF